MFLTSRHLIRVHDLRGKRDWLSFEAEYPEWFEFVRSHRKRFDSCDASSKKGREEWMHPHFLKRIISDATRYRMNVDLLYYPLYDDFYFEIVIGWIANFFIERNYWHYWIFGRHVSDIAKLEWHLKRIKAIRPPTFCINDDGQEWANNQLIQRFYNEFFPEPSHVEM